MPSLSFKIILAVFLGGGLGSSLRFIISVMMRNVSQQQLPWATLTANVLSCILLVTILIIFNEKLQQNDWLKALLVVGFCGGLSTFSTFSFETYALIKSGQVLWAMMNVVVSITLCLSIFYFFLKKI